MKNTIRTRLGLGGAAATAALVLAGLAGPAATAQAYGTSPEELASACTDGIGEANISVSCTFEAAYASSYFQEWHRYGDPVTNCAGGSNDVVSQIVASRTFTETWSAGGKFGVSGGGISIEGNSSYSASTATTTGVNRTLEAGPGEKVAATVGTTFAVEEGRMRVDIYDNGGGGDQTFTDTYYIEGTQRTVPTGAQEQGQDQVPCGQKFTIDPEQTPV
ncbi:hypothetical protein N1027_06475 [Herbiconiux sp. CPCC 205763]|uniref:Secreted protein n=1 Tax=Herbiconiux aconitum TaxID=2970913 RepID=A0ABT2GNH6_9MICO|nr:hypothetical protein [Herbiconiux aconitum]MCS5717778.1 hypothetical protein [Herbiconiux aconitum]